MADNTKEIEIVDMFTRMYFFVKRYYLIIISSIIIGVIVGLIYQNRKVPYVSSMIISSIIKDDVLKEIIKRSIWENENLKNIDIKFDSTKNVSQNIIVITVKSHDKKIFNTLYNYILEYVKNNQYLKNRYDFIINYNKKMIIELNKQIEIVKTKQISDNINDKINIQNTLSSDVLVYLYDRRFSAEELLNISHDIIYKISDFSEPKVVSKNIIITSVMFVFIFLFLGIILATAIEVMRIAKKRNKEQLL